MSRLIWFAIGVISAVAALRLCFYAGSLYLRSTPPKYPNPRPANTGVPGSAGVPAGFIGNTDIPVRDSKPTLPSV